MNVVTVAGEGHKNASLYLNIGIGLSNMKKYHAAIEQNENIEKVNNEKRNKRLRREYIAKLGNIQIGLKHRVKVTGNYFGGPGFEFLGKSFDIDEMEEVFKLLAGMGYYYFEKVKSKLKASRNWLWGYMLIGPSIGIISGLKMRSAFDYAEKAADILNQALFQNDDLSRKLFVELKLLNYKAKVREQREMASNYSFFGIIVGGGFNLYDGHSISSGYSYYYDSYVDYSIEEASSFHVGFRFSKMWSLGKTTHLKFGFISDLYVDIRNIYETKTYYATFDLMASIKYKSIYFGIGGSAALRMPGENYPNNDFYKKYDFAIVAEQGWVFGKTVKIMIGVKFKYYLHKVNYIKATYTYDYTSYSYTAEYKEMSKHPFGLYGHISLGF